MLATSPQPPATLYGIDFGTSNTVVTCQTGHQTRILPLDDGGIIPSLLYFAKDRPVSIGSSAIHEYGQALHSHRNSSNLYSTFRFFQAIKLALKNPAFSGTRIFGQFWPAESLAGLFLREVKRLADEATGSQVDQVVLGRPVVLGADPTADAALQGRFHKTCLFAGFRAIDFVYEPVGAMLSDGTTYQGKVLVFDFGGGTLDISIASIGNGQVSLLANAGLDLGGYSLNEDLSRARVIGHFGFHGKFRTMTGRYLDMPTWITDQVASFYALPLAELAKTRNAIKDLIPEARAADKPKLKGLLEFIDCNMAFDLFDRIDQAKIRLSDSQTTAIEFAVPPFVQLAESVSRPAFESMIAPRVGAARSLILAALCEAGLQPVDIDRVVRVGGSCRIPAFIRLLEDLFPGRVSAGEAFTSIAAGLIAARQLGLTVHGTNPPA
ncbi:MAG: hypothetical protein A2087_08845 [Spirochaetes bacterium GWD1_61_31]|nr:MAG: hypothetical protein A2Y37_13530 [Spirochaetes bacterium GWB1_60_80]OHD30065.1 MAG: hypothetical protein A2004_03600 [Spirochaetes bacterium GWC1_61_12]OHD42541.1 MAG: hypothetical protein A2087_08845 [Spirochaetes bacterium GWD1_61_31]OHD45073.1 MAG: hypothetical protein A2Y35_12750 [Spirochaetes bacterium GWE1_60_18]OHD60001.1 MAG: hypothetical protein A2Y32_14600 [Spirochaetes bacterium GWF1_60_12]